jgi:phospholipase C
MALADIAHIVVLMLENRSFDCMMGNLYPKSPDFDGLSGTEANEDFNGTPVRVWNSGDTSKASMSIPDPDPGELFTDINMQLFGSSEIADPAPPPTMSGFVKSYLSQTAKPAASYSANSVMHFFKPEQVPVISTLARSFAVCDRWYASAPCQTWPNRFFVHTGTANGYENNAPPHFPYEMETIFNRLEQAHLAWKVYFHDIAQSLTLSKLWPHAGHFRLYLEFQHDARLGNLPEYSFIEPRYFTDLTLANDQHPPHVVTLGEQLIADVYNCIRAGPGWTKTLLVITYDEHGGCYDHAAPPRAAPPSVTATTPFNFERYGVRVPAVIVSPYVPAGLKLRAAAGDVPFDHTSIIATLRRRFPLGGPLGNRDAVAPDLAAALTLPGPNNSGPERIDALPYVPSPAEVATARTAPLNKHQRSLLQLAAHLPATTAVGEFKPFIDSYLDHLRAGAAGTDVDAIHDVSSAVTLIKRRLGNLFRSI